MSEMLTDKRIQCEFDGTPAVKHLLTAMIGIPMLGLIFLLLSGMYFIISMPGVAIGCLSCCAVMLAALIIHLKLGKGTITADEKDVYVHYGFLSRTIAMSDISEVRCEVKSTGTRYGGVIYTMFLLIETKGGKSYRYEQELNIEKDYPTNHPVEYKAYLNNQPMQKLGNYISKRV